MVWKSSRQIGIGRAESRDGKLFVVANFFPAGNTYGDEPHNVFPARHQSTGVRNGKGENRLPSHHLVRAESSPYAGLKILHSVTVENFPHEEDGRPVEIMACMHGCQLRGVIVTFPFYTTPRNPLIHPREREMLN
jgi:hypothetical protein